MSNEPSGTNNGHDLATESGSEEIPAGLRMKDPTDTEHPTGEQQAHENAETESPS